MGLNFTVNDTYENAMFIYMHIVAVLSILIAGPTFYLLYFKTHKNSQRYRILLILVVVWTTLMDLHFGALFIPLPLFPIVGGYCIGPLCSIGLPMHFSLTIMFLIVTGVCAAIINCFLFRHQAVLPPYSRLKISDKQFNLLCLAVYLVFETPSLAMIWAYSDTLTGEEYLMEFHPAMMWIMKKPNWVVYDTRSATSIMILLLFLGFGGIVFLLIGHTFYILAKQGNHMSERTRKFQRNLTGTLVLQFFLLGSFLGIPLGVFCVSVLTYLVPYELIAACTRQFDQCASQNRQENEERFSAARKIKIECHQELSECVRDATRTEDSGVWKAPLFLFSVYGRFLSGCMMGPFLTMSVLVHDDILRYDL